nr:protein srg1 [Quercus suber]
MEPEITTLGSSIPVPCVQELAKETTSTVPPRYVRFPNEPPIISDTTSLPQVPVIDMQRLFSAEFKYTELEKLHHASKEWGFFQLINHGVSISLVEKVKVGIQELFNLPREEKKKLWQLPGDIEGFGQAFVVSEEQKLDWGDMFYMIVTNGIYRSIEHRATVNSAKERLSVATFYSPSLEADMGPAPSLITPESPALFKRIGVADYFRQLFSRELDGKAFIDSMRIQKGT